MALFANERKRFTAPESRVPPAVLARMLLRPAELAVAGKALPPERVPPRRSAARRSAPAARLSSSAFGVYSLGSATLARLLIGRLLIARGASSVGSSSVGSHRSTVRFLIGSSSVSSSMLAVPHQSFLIGRLSSSTPRRSARLPPLLVVAFVLVSIFSSFVCSCHLALRCSRHLEPCREREPRYRQ